jgi:hypothetical protein
MNEVEIEQMFKEKAKRGVVKKQDLNSYELIEKVMRKGYENGIVWWFAYELMGFHEIDGKRYWLSYKASTRVSEMSGDIGTVLSRPTNGKMHLYRLKELVVAKKPEQTYCPHGLPTFVACPNCRQTV